MIEHDGFLAGGKRDDTGVRSIEAHVAVARSPHARGGLGGRAAASGLRFGGTVRA